MAWLLQWVDLADNLVDLNCSEVFKGERHFKLRVCLLEDLNKLALPYSGPQDQQW